MPRSYERCAELMNLIFGTYKVTQNGLLGIKLHKNRISGLRAGAVQTWTGQGSNPVPLTQTYRLDFCKIGRNYRGSAVREISYQLD